MQRGAFTFTRPRLIQVGLIVVLAVLGSALPYLTLGYQDYASQPIRPTRSLWPAADLLSRLNILYLPSWQTVGDVPLQRGVDVLTLGVRAQQVGVVVAVLSAIGLCMDEINKFLWWPLHIAGWLLAVGGVIFGAGVVMFRSADVDLVPGPGPVPLLVAGVLAVVFTLRARGRLDRYRGF